MTLDSYRPCGLEETTANGPSLLLAEHHRELRKIGNELMACAEEQDTRALIEQYRTFEQHVLEHMRAEEQLILPEFERENPTEAAEIRAGHERLRRQLDATACQIELHEVRLETLRALGEELEQHARREDKIMYPWAQVHLPRDRQHVLRDRLLASLRRLARFVAGA